MHTGRMSQTSTERLRDYLAQLPPQAQALLMREFERAIERGEDVAVANFVLEQLRKIVRGTDEEARPRTDDPARLLFRPLEPFLVEGNVPVRPGQIRRASLLPVWQWLIRDGAPDQAREFEAALARIRETGTTTGLEAAIGKFQGAAADAISTIATPVYGDKQRALTRVGPPDVIEDLLSIGSVLQAREALDTLNYRLPKFLRVFADSQIASVGASLNVPVSANAATAAVRAVAGHAAADRAVGSNRNLVVSRVDLDQHVTFFDVLVVAYVHGNHVAGDARTDGREVDVHLRSHR